MPSGPAAEELVFALCHEVGNLLAALRLHGEFLDEEAGPRISELAGRAGALLALVRPLLSPAPSAAATLEPLELLEGLRRALDDPRVRIELRSAVELPDVSIDGEVLYHLLLADLLAALEALPEGERVRLSAEASPGAVAFVVEAPVHPARSAPDAPGARLAGRGLTRALAEAILAKRGAGVTGSRGDAWTRAAFRVPAAG